MSSGSRGTELAKALALWERRHLAFRRAADTLARVSGAHARTELDVRCAAAEIVMAAEAQGRAEALRVRVPRDAKLHRSQLRQLAWLQAREAERLREVAMMRGCCNVLQETLAAAAERVDTLRAANAAGADGGAALTRYLAWRQEQAAAVEIPL